MLNFLRNLRRKEMKGKYLKYAIGEIVLVVIGILIALKVSDWNEDRKLEIQEQEFLVRLLEDLDIIQLRMNDAINDTTFIIMPQKALLLVQNCDFNAADKASLDTSLLTHGILGSIYNRDATYTEMLSNGAFSRLGNDKLKTSVSDLYSFIDNSNDYISYFREELGRASAIIEAHVSFQFKEGAKPEIWRQDQIAVSYSFKELCQSSQFKNALVELIDSRQDVYSMNRAIYEMLEQTKKIIRAEVN